MSGQRSVNVDLTPEQEAFIASRVASGRYRTASDVVRAGLRLLETHELERDAARQAVREKIAVGLEQARRGELLDGDAVFAELDERDSAWHGDADPTGSS